MKKLFFILIAFGLLTLNSCKDDDAPTQSLSAELDPIMQDALKKNGLVGLSAAIVKNNATIWQGYYGKANKEAGTPVDKETIFRVASLAKPCTALAILKLMENGALHLDDDINDHLSFKVIHPNFPEHKITIRHLLTHTAGISDRYMQEIFLDHFVAMGEDHPATLEEYCKSLVTPEGQFYNTNTFSDNVPGTVYEYSNVAVTILGCIVQQVSGMSFEQYSKQVLFQPLGLQSTFWHLKDGDLAKFAMPYQLDGTLYGLYTTPDFVSGGLNSNVNDLSRILILMMNNGVYRNQQLFSATAIQEMKRVQFPDEYKTELSFQGLLWETVPLGKYTYAGHSGNMPGSNAYMYYNPEQNIGLVITYNMDHEAFSQQALIALMDKLIEAGAAAR